LRARRVVLTGAHPLERRLHRTPPRAGHALDLADVPVDLDDALRRLTRSVVEAVDVLRDEEVQGALLLEVDEGPVARVRLGVEVVAVEAVLPGAAPYLGVAHVVVERGRLLRGRVLGPDAVGTAEVADPRFGGHAGAGEHDDAVGVAQLLGDAVDITHA